MVLGDFDGIHLGIKPFFERARKVADERGLMVTVLTYLTVSPEVCILLVYASNHRDI